MNNEFEQKKIEVLEEKCKLLMDALTEANDEIKEMREAIEEFDVAFNWYQKNAMRTKGGYADKFSELRNAASGMNGEAGEVIDLLKKHEFQGHDLDKSKVAEEIGDLLWYCALGADALGISLSRIAEANIEKLWKRYPAGFDSIRSRNRTE